MSLSAHLVRPVERPMCGGAAPGPAILPLMCAPPIGSVTPHRSISKRSVSGARALISHEAGFLTWFASAHDLPPEDVQHLQRLEVSHGHAVLEAARIAEIEVVVRGDRHVPFVEIAITAVIGQMLDRLVEIPERNIHLLR